MRQRTFTLLIAVLAVVQFSCSPSRHALRSGDRIVFFGDSITQLGVKPGGYVTLIRDSLARTQPGVEVIGAGISGNKVTDLQARLDRDVLSDKPSVVFIYIGINDVWHWALKNLKGTTPEAYVAGLREVITKIQAVGGRVILCTPTVIGEKHPGENTQDAMLDEYAKLSRSVARETRAELCDLHAMFQSYLKDHNPDDKDRGILTYDGVHLSDDGNRIVAQAMLEALNKMEN